MRYSPSVGCFYPEHIAYPDLPDDLIELDDKTFKAWTLAPVGSTIALNKSGVAEVVLPPPTPLPVVKQIKCSELQAAYRRATTKPVVTVKVSSGVHDFDNTPNNIANLEAVVAGKARNWKAKVWMDASGKLISSFTYNDAKKVAEALASATPPDFQQLLDKLAAVDAAQSAAAVEAITLD